MFVVEEKVFFACGQKTKEEKEVPTKFALHLEGKFAIIASFQTRGVSSLVERQLPKPASDRNENHVFATVSCYKRVRETKLSRYLSGYKILYLQG